MNSDAFVPEPVCGALPEAHQHGRCSCSGNGGSGGGGGGGGFSPWIVADTMTPAGQSLLASGPTTTNVFEGDSHGNTILHFLASRATAEALVRALETNLCDAIINMRNMAGQTFLHLIKSGEARKPDQIRRLLQAAHRRRFDVCAQDLYGRNVLHILRSAGLPWETLQRSCATLERARYDKRDAFGLVPSQSGSAGNGAETMRAGSTLTDASSTTSPTPSIDPAFTRQASLLKKIWLAFKNPLLEDDDGGNGLHCLAVATLSSDSIMDKYRMNSDAVVVGQGRPSDSSSARLDFRYSLAAGLLDAGVDPNHYDGQGNTPLMVFAAELPEDGDCQTGLKILDLLVDKGANVHARNRAGETALHVAVRRGRKLAMRTLVRHGASVDARDAEGRSVRDVAEALTLAGSSAASHDPREQARLEACRAWLSSNNGLAVQRLPTGAMDDWMRVQGEFGH